MGYPSPPCGAEIVGLLPPFTLRHGGGGAHCTSFTPDCGVELVGPIGLPFPLPVGVKVVYWVPRPLSLLCEVCGFIGFPPSPLWCEGGGVHWVPPPLPLWCGGGGIQWVPSPLTGVEVVGFIGISHLSPIVVWMWWGSLGALSLHIVVWKWCIEWSLPSPCGGKFAECIGFPPCDVKVVRFVGSLSPPPLWRKGGW